MLRAGSRLPLAKQLHEGEAKLHHQRVAGWKQAEGIALSPSSPCQMMLKGPKAQRFQKGIRDSFISGR